MFLKLKKVYSLTFLPGFRTEFPELNGLTAQAVNDRLRKMGVSFYTVENTPVTLWVRLTLPFAVIVWLLAYASLPILFMFTGQWGYSNKRGGWLLNWMRELHLF